MDDELLTLGASSGTDVRNTVYEEHTVSGAIVSFSDGADTVPLKKCEITLPASLDGYSSVSVKQAGASFGTFTNGYGIGLDGLPQPTATRVATLTPIAIDPDTTYKVYSETNQNFIIGVINNGTLVRRTAYIPSGSTIDTSGGTDLYVCMYNAQNNTVTVENDKPIVFESTETITTHTASLGRTIHGGTADVVNGDGVNGYGYVDLGTLTWTKRNTSSGHWRFTTQDVPVVINDDSSHIPSMDCIEYTAISPTQSWNGVKGVSCNTGISQLMVCDETYETASEFTTAVSGVYLVYPLATPDPFTFEPVEIDSKSGNNTIWSEQGTNVEVTYYSEREVINNYNVTATQLTAIADAIREKKQSTAPILFEDIPDEILTIETGGGGEDAITWVFTASGNADNYYYTAQEDGLYLAVAVRNQNTGCSISLPDGGDVVLTSTLISPRFQMKVVRLTTGQRVKLGIYNSTHVRGGWVFKLNVTPSTIAYTRAADQYGTYNMVNQGTSNVVISILATVWGNSYGGWDPTMKFFGLSPLNGSANIRIMYGIDMAMPAIPYGGPSTCQWILNIQED